MSKFYVNYLKKHKKDFPEYVKQEIRAHSKHRAYILGTYSKGTEKHSKLLKHLRAQTKCALQNSRYYGQFN